MEKIEYLKKVFKRSAGKDFENYIVTAIWHRLNNPNLRPVTQQYISKPKDKQKHYFIDLYFPDIKVGIEADELFHENNQKKDKHRDKNIKKQLKPTVFDLINDISTSKYRSFRISETEGGNYRPFGDIEKDIDKAIEIIKGRIKKMKPKLWTKIESPEEYFANKKQILITDNIGFSSINQAIRILFDPSRKDSKGQINIHFTPKTFKETEYAGYKVWFPKLSIKDENGIKSSASNGFINELKNKGKTIIESNQNWRKEKLDKINKANVITFIKYRYLGKWQYKFIGIFKYVDFDAHEKQLRLTRIDDRCSILNNLGK